MGGMSEMFHSGALGDRQHFFSKPTPRVISKKSVNLQINLHRKGCTAGLTG